MKPAAILTLLLLTSCAPCHKWAEAVRAGVEPDARTVCRCYLSQTEQMTNPGMRFRQGFFLYYDIATTAGEGPAEACRYAAEKMAVVARRWGVSGEIARLDAARKVEALLWGRDGMNAQRIDP